MIRHCLKFIFLTSCIRENIHDINQQNEQTCPLDIFTRFTTHLTFLHTSVGKELHQGITPK